MQSGLEDFLQKSKRATLRVAAIIHAGQRFFFGSMAHDVGSTKRRE
jgi:hypothetical protein